MQEVHHNIPVSLIRDEVKRHKKGKSNATGKEKDCGTISEEKVKSHKRRKRSKTTRKGKKSKATRATRKEQVKCRFPSQTTNNPICLGPPWLFGYLPTIR